jgi:carbamoyl-phosphate synthase small subunit
MKAILALEDGTIFEGTSIGATGTVTGEACFNTAVMGYQEILTDPAHCGQILAMTYSLIGNYGINEEDNESNSPQAAALVIGELSNIHSNWRADSPMGDWLKKHGTPGIEGVDTRRLARHLRINGSMRACVILQMDHLDDRSPRLLNKYKQLYEQAKKKTVYKGVIEAEKRALSNFDRISMGLLFE